MHGAIASMIRSAWRVRSSDCPTSEPIRLPTSRLSTGRPTSLPRALQNCDFPHPGGDSNNTPRGRLRELPWCDRSMARLQNALSADRPPRLLKSESPRYRDSRPLFFSVWVFISHTASDVIRSRRTSDKLKAFSASIRVSPAAASRMDCNSESSGNSPSSVAMPRAISSSSWRLGRSCSITTNIFSSSVGICTTGESTTTIVRFCLPVMI